MIRIPQPRPASEEPRDDAPNDTVLLTDVVDEQSIRQGSPFAAGSTLNPVTRHLDRNSATNFENNGPMQYTAVGALVSCVVVLGFAIPAAVWFPPGGILITILGVLLAVFGLQSRHFKGSLVLLAVQLVLFLYCVSAIQT